MGELPRPIPDSIHPDPPFAKLVEYWLRAQRVRLAGSTFQNRRGFAARIADRLGTFTLSEVTPVIVVQYVHDRLSQGVTAATAENERRLLCSITSYAAELGLGADPLATMKRTLVRPEDGPRNPARPLSLDELAQFLGIIARADRRSSNRSFPQLPFWLALSETGARCGELRAARWMWISLDDATLVVDKSVAKSRRSRCCPLRPSVVEALRSLLPIHERLLGRVPGPQDLVFLSRRGNPLQRGTQARFFDAVLHKARIAKRDEWGRRVSPHSLRHTLATRFLESGVPEKYAAEMLGHTTSALTRRVYQHTRVSALRSALERVWEAESRPDDNEKGVSQ